jgi:hypothetical protein
MSSTPLSKEKPMKSPAMPPRDTAKENSSGSLQGSNIMHSTFLGTLIYTKCAQGRLKDEKVVHSALKVVRKEFQVSLKPFITTNGQSLYFPSI